MTLLWNLITAMLMMRASRLMSHTSRSLWMFQLDITVWSRCKDADSSVTKRPPLISGTSSTAATPWRTPRPRSTCGSRPRSSSPTPPAPRPGCTSKSANHQPVNYTQLDPPDPAPSHLSSLQSALQLGLHTPAWNMEHSSIKSHVNNNVSLRVSLPVYTFCRDNISSS